MNRERENVPNRFYWIRCQGPDMLVPMPTTWFYIPSSRPGTIAYTFAPTSVFEGHHVKPAMSINVMPKLGQEMEMSANELSYHSWNENTVEKRVSEVAEVEDETFFSVRGVFDEPKQNTDRLLLPPQRFYADYTVNKITGTFYSTVFNSPRSEEGRYRDIAKVMVDQRVLNKSF